MRKIRMLTLPRRILILCLLVASLFVLSFGPGLRAKAADSCYGQYFACIEPCDDDPDLTYEGCVERCQTALDWCLYFED